MKKKRKTSAIKKTKFVHSTNCFYLIYEVITFDVENFSLFLLIIVINLQRAKNEKMTLNV
jgi:hypothetical protein